MDARWAGVGWGGREDGRVSRGWGAGREVGGGEVMLQCCAVGLVRLYGCQVGWGEKGRGGLMMLDGRSVGWGLGG